MLLPGHTRSTSVRVATTNGVVAPASAWPRRSPTHKGNSQTTVTLESNACWVFGVGVIGVIGVFGSDA